MTKDCRTCDRSEEFCLSHAECDYDNFVLWENIDALKAKLQIAEEALTCAYEIEKYRHDCQGETILMCSLREALAKIKGSV